MERRCWEIEQNPRKEMNQDTFWALIQEAKTACGQDMDAMEAYLYNQLVSMGPAAAKGFHDLLQTYEDLADQYGLWDAASIIKEHGCSDDGFIDFRALREELADANRTLQPVQTGTAGAVDGDVLDFLRSLQEGDGPP